MTEAVTLDFNDGISTITLNRPHTLNAFDESQCRQLTAAVDRVAGDEQTRVVILTGAGRGFSSGADLMSAPIAGISFKQRLDELFRPSIVGLMEMPKPVIAAVNGPAAGIGVAYVLAADLVLMADSGFLMQPFININLVPDGGITWHLARKLGHQRAFEFIVSGERIEAERCHQWGLVNRVVPGEDLLKHTQEWAEELLTKAPLAMQFSKQALRKNMISTFEEGFELEGELQELLGHSQDTAEGVRAFDEKRKPIFKGI